MLHICVGLNMLFNNFCKITLLFLLSVFGFYAHSEILQVNVSNNMTVLDSNGIKSSLIQVSNPDEHIPRYVKIGVYYIDPTTIGTGNEKTIEVKGELRKDHIVTLPDKIIIPPAGRTNVRVVYTGGKLEKDNNYKVRFYPITELEFKGGDDKDHIESSLFFSISSTAFVTVSKSEPNYLLEHLGNKIKNSGDSLMLLQNCKVCRGNHCKAFDEFRLPPNRSVDFSRLNQDEGELTWTCELIEPSTGTRVIKND